MIDVEMETKYPVDTWRIFGIRVWPFIRVCLNFQLQKINKNNALTTDDNIQKKKCKVERITRSIISMLQEDIYAVLSDISDYSHRDSVHKSDIFFLTVNMDRVFSMPDGTFYDRVLDPVKESLTGRGYEVYSLELGEGKKTRLPRYSKSSFFQVRRDYFRMKSFFETKVRFNEKLDSDLHLPKFEEFVVECADYGCSIQLKSLITGMRYIVKMKAYFKEIFKRCGTKLVVTRCWYGPDMMALSAAAKDMGIHVVDVQHGVAGGGEHHLYCEWRKVPKDGYELVPDVFWCNTETDADAIRHWNNADLNTKVIVGGRSLQLFWQSSKGKEVVAQYMERFRQNVIVPKKSKVILFSLQSLSKNTERYQEWLPKFILENEEFFWLVRCHPIMDETQKKFLEKIKGIPNVNVDEASSYPLDVVLEFSDVHVTMFSTVAIEAAEHGIATVFLADSRDFSAVMPAKYILHGLSYESLYDSLHKGVDRRSEAEEEKHGVMAIRELEALLKMTEL